MIPLLDAENAFVQAAAAIYLSFDQSEAAITRMKDKAQLPDLPGAWVALALVRRGYSEYMTRALTLYRPYPSDWVQSRDVDSTHEVQSGPRLIYDGPWHELESMLNQHVSYLCEKYMLNELLLPHPFLSVPLNQETNSQRQLNYKAALDWWEKSKSAVADTRDPLIDDWIALRID